MHTYTYICLRTYIHTKTHIQPYIYKCTHIHKHTHTRAHTYMHTYIHTSKIIYTPPHTRAYIQCLYTHVYKEKLIVIT